MTGYRPQLATLVKTPPAGDEWLPEIKFDGYRIGCRIRAGRATLISRNGKHWTAAFPGVADAAARLKVRDALLDGEVAMLLPDGRTSFQALQNAFAGAASRAGLVYFIFDLLRLDGRSLEIHTWNSVFEDLERPNRVVFNLDPGDEVEWAEVVRAARQVRRVLAALRQRLTAQRIRAVADL